MFVNGTRVDPSEIVRNTDGGPYDRNNNNNKIAQIPGPKIF